MVTLTEVGTLDVAELLSQAYEVGDMINSSAEAADYAYWKQQVESNKDIQSAVKQFAKLKEKFEETERFGHFHPDYHAALDKVKEAEVQLDEFEAVRQFKAAEAKLDELLFSVSETIAHSVSEAIKVPSNNPMPTKSGCGSGGCSSCG